MGRSRLLSHSQCFGELVGAGGAAATTVGAPQGIGYGAGVAAFGEDAYAGGVAGAAAEEADVAYLAFAVDFKIYATAAGAVRCIFTFHCLIKELLDIVPHGSYGRAHKDGGEG